jgi:hypothetical protein
MGRSGISSTQYEVLRFVANLRQRIGTLVKPSSFKVIDVLKYNPRRLALFDDSDGLPEETRL